MRDPEDMGEEWTDPIEERMSRDRNDPAYVDAVIARYFRRRDRVQRREQAIADLKAALWEDAEPIERFLGWLTRKLGR